MSLTISALIWCNVTNSLSFWKTMLHCVRTTFAFIYTSITNVIIACTLRILCTLYTFISLSITNRLIWIWTMWILITFITLTIRYTIPITIDLRALLGCWTRFTYICWWVTDRLIRRTIWILATFNTFIRRTAFFVWRTIRILFAFNTVTEITFLKSPKVLAIYIINTFWALLIPTFWFCLRKAIHIWSTNTFRINTFLFVE